MSQRPVVLDVTVPSEDLSYPVLIGDGVLERVGVHVKRAVPRAKRVALISDTNVMPLYGDAVRSSLRAQGIEAVPNVIEAGEPSKSPATLLRLLSTLVKAGLGRNDAIVALGGGVVGDLAGFVAATFMRGVGLVQIPTSLLAQVDSSVGGKVAVDLPEGKNLMGAFHFPRAVVIDPVVLQTLPDVELACGLAEMLKHGALFDADHFATLGDRADAIYARDGAALGPLVATSVALKAACVIRDPLEKSDAGKGRVVLNLGHTVGHAIEAVSNYEVRHGEAVALGLIAAARISMRKGLCASDLEASFTRALKQLRLPTDLERWLTPDHIGPLTAALRNDKKRKASTVTYIGLAALAKPHILSLEIDDLFALLQAGAAAE